jgi:hypothetical protein
MRFASSLFDITVDDHRWARIDGNIRGNGRLKSVARLLSLWDFVIPGLTPGATDMPRLRRSLRKLFGVRRLGTAFRSLPVAALPPDVLKACDLPECSLRTIHLGEAEPRECVKRQERNAVGKAEPFRTSIGKAASAQFQTRVEPAQDRWIMEYLPGNQKA